MRPIALLILILSMPLLASAAEPPLFSIDRSTAASHADRLTPGHRALLDTLPETFRIDVHATTAVAADSAASTPAHLDAEGRIGGIGPGLPFPDIEPGDPDGGLKAIWNHRLRVRGIARERATVQAAVATDGSANVVEVRQRQRWPLDAAGEGRIAQHALAIVAPARLAGSLKLIDEPIAGATRGWQRSPGPRWPSLKATTDAGADTPVIGSDGLFNEDQRDGYAGDPARWRWKIIARRPLLMPWNAAFVHARDGGDPTGLLLARHPDPARLRHEVREVWIVDARLKPGESSRWPSRRYYVDTASGQVLLVELHGVDDRLARVHEIHVEAVDGRWLPSVDVVHDVREQRWFIAGIETAPPAPTTADGPADAFEPGPVRRWAKAVGEAARVRR